MATKIKMCGNIGRQYCIICLMLLAFHAKLHSCEANATSAVLPSDAKVENSTAAVTNLTTGSVTGSDEVTTAPETISEQVSQSADYQSTEPNVRKSDQEPLDKQEMFLKLIFDKYGKDGTITYEGFEHLMVSLGLGNIKIAHTLDEHWNKDQGLFKEFHKDHAHPLDSGEGEGHEGHDHASHDHDGHDHNDHSHGSTETDDYDDYGFLSGIFDNDLTTASSGDRNEKSKPERSTLDRLKTDFTTSSAKQEMTTPGTKTPTETATKGSKDTEYSKCMSPPNLLNAFHQSEAKGVTRESFIKLCPAIIYQIDLHTCSRNGCKGRPSTGAHVRSHGDHDHDHNHDHDHDHLHKSPLNSTTAGWDFLSIPLEVWGYSTLSVLVISLVGLCGVAIVPVIQKVFYTHLIQYLVALAVGSLAGDAMLHLLPHAISKHSHDAPADDHGHDHAAEEGGHLDGVWKGLMGLAGIYIFFIMERLMVIINEHRRRRPKKEGQGEGAIQSEVEVVVDQIESEGEEEKKGRFRKLEDGSNKIGNKLCNHQVLYKSCEDIVLVMHHDKAIKDLAHEASGRSCRQTGSEDGCCEESERLSEVTNETIADDQSEATPRAHGHSHGGHGHSHGKVPTTVASVAWMVILGDGLHNFSDGLAIGAAFANSLTGGLSTSIAVFCHELPHELGDFAVLLHAGMSVKQALVYNGVSSILCFLGMLIGVSIGNMAGASLWIFSLTAGMFLYIALVDMLPEMANVDSKSNSILHFVLQNFGMLTGIAIMLLIAIYEDKIMIEL